VTKSKQGKKRLTLMWWNREIQMAEMHKKLMIIKPYFKRLPKNDQTPQKKMPGTASS
jgi:hypothetical protein